MRYVVGEVIPEKKIQGPTYWHVIDEAGLDPHHHHHLMNPLSTHQTLCGRVYGCDPHDDTTEAFGMCPECSEKVPAPPHPPTEPSLYDFAHKSHEEQKDPPQGETD